MYKIHNPENHRSMKNTEQQIGLFCSSQPNFVSLRTWQIQQKHLKIFFQWQCWFKNPFPHVIQLTPIWFFHLPPPRLFCEAFFSGSTGSRYSTSTTPSCSFPTLCSPGTRGCVVNACSAHTGAAVALALKTKVQNGKIAMGYNFGMISFKM